MKFAVALNEQSRFGPDIVGEFIRVVSCIDPATGISLHIFKGKFATNMDELAEQVNEASQALLDWDNPWARLRVIKLEGSDLDDSTKTSLLQANGELLGVIDRLEERGFVEAKC